MARRMFKAAGAAAAMAMLVAACTTTVQDPTDEPAASISQQAAVSECGGFPRAADSGDAPAYCEAEVLYWSYERDSEQLHLDNTRAELNCCGDHGMAIEKVGGVYVATETDAPEGVGLGSGARCDCMCVFDFSLSAEGLPEEAIQLRLVRHVTDEGPAQTLFEGTLDLSQGSGFEILDSTASMWCELDSSSDDAPSAS